jgi:hypothetical protein
MLLLKGCITYVRVLQARPARFGDVVQGRPTRNLFDTDHRSVRCPHRQLYVEEVEEVEEVDQSELLICGCYKKLGFFLVRSKYTPCKTPVSVSSFINRKYARCQATVAYCRLHRC